MHHGKRERMTKLAPAMYEICAREAISQGPRVKNVNGELRSVYGLSRSELSKIFERAGYKKDRIAWLKVIIAFRDTWDEIAPSDTVILNPDERNWSVIFIHLTDTQKKDLQWFAEDNKIPALAVME